MRTGWKQKILSMLLFTVIIIQSIAIDSGLVMAQTIPNSVTKFSVLKTSTNQIDLRWDKQNSDGYEIYRYNTSHRKYLKIADINDNNTTTYADKNVKSGYYYKYKIKSYNYISGKRFYSKESNVLIGMASLQTPYLQGESNNTNSISLKWNKVDRAYGYKVYRYYLSSKTYKEIKNIKGSSTTSYTDTNRTSGCYYYYKVKAYRIVNGKYMYSNESNREKIVVKPSTPKVSGVAYGNKNYIQWNKINKASAYKIYRYDSNTKSYKEIGDTKSSSTTNFTDTNVKSGEYYYYRVVAYRTVSGKNTYSDQSSSIKLGKSGTTQTVKTKTVTTDINYYRNNTKGRHIKETFTVSPGYGREVSLQMYNSSTGKWETKYKTNASNYNKSTVVLYYPDIWHQYKNSTWRIYIPETQKATEYISDKISVNTIMPNNDTTPPNSSGRKYQNPSGYFQITDNISFSGQGGYTLKYGSMGLKVRKVQQKLGMSSSNKAIIGPMTSAKIAAFKSRHGLPATGIVDYTTWKAMGLSYVDWNYLGSYVSPLKINKDSTRSDCVEAMIDRAYDYLGDEYIIGAAGKPGQGLDCSGLVMQSLYAAGINPLPVSVIRHSQPGYEYESRYLYESSKFKKVSYSDRKRGDLIFYKGKSGNIIHVAIYLGNDKVIESWPKKVVVWPIKNSHRSAIAGVRRVFI